MNLASSGKVSWPALMTLALGTIERDEQSVTIAPDLEKKRAADRRLFNAFSHIGGVDYSAMIQLENHVARLEMPLRNATWCRHQFRRARISAISRTP